MDHNVSCIRSGTSRSEQAGDSVNLCVLSISRVVGNSDESAHHVVECKLEGFSTVLRRSFFSTSSEDPEGRASALRFALCTDSLPAFKSYLRGHREKLNSAPRRPACFTVYTSVRQNTFCGIYFTAAIFLLPDGSSHSISFRNSQRPKGPVTCPVVQFMQSPAFFRWENKISKAADEETSSSKRGREEKDREDFTCSICLKIPMEKIYTIRLDEQKPKGIQCLDDLLNEARSTYMDFGCNACCVCGCDENEDLDNVVPCPCNNSNALVHSGCAATCKGSIISMLRSDASCIMCGSSQAVMKTQPVGAVHTVSQGSDLGMKKAWMCNGANVAGDPESQSFNVPRVENDGESEIRLSDKHGVKRFGWRFHDAPAVVPIKKRRIQIREISRSPSPEPKKLSSEPISRLENSSSTKLTSESFDFPYSELKMNSSSSQTVFDSSSSNLSALTHSSAIGSLSNSLCSSKGMHTQSPKSTSGDSKEAFLPLEASPEPILSVPSDSKHENVWSLKLIPEASESPTSIIKSPSMNSPLSNMLLLPKEYSLKPASSFSEIHLSIEVTQAQPAPCHAIHTEEVPRDVDKGFLSSVVSAAKRQLDNNQEVEDGELVVSRDSNVEDLEVTKESPEVTSQRMKSYIPAGKFKVNGFRDDRSGWDLNSEMETWNKITSATTTKENLSVNIPVIKDELEENRCSPLSEYNKCFKYGPRKITETTTRLVECNEHGVVEYNSRDGGSGMVANARSTTVMNETKFLEESCEKHTFMLKVSKGGPWTANVWTGNQLQHPATVDANEHGEISDHVSLGNKTASDCSEGKKNDDVNFESRFSSDSIRPKRTGWDQLPEGFDNAEYALRAARETLSKGPHGHKGSSSLRSSTSSSQLGRHRYGSGRDLSKDGLADSRSHNRHQDRHVKEPSWRRGNFARTRQSDDNVEDYNRGRSSGSEATGYSSRGRSNEWDDALTGSKSQWSQGRHQRPGVTSSPNRSKRAVTIEGGFVASGDAAGRDGTGCSSLKFTFESNHGGRGHYFSLAHIPPSDGSNLSNTVDKMADSGGRVFHPAAGSGHGSMDRYGPSYGGKGSEVKSDSSLKIHSSDNHRGHCPESRVTRSRLSSASIDSFAHSKSFSVTSRRSKWSSNRGEVDGFREKDSKRCMRRSYGSSGRTSPHVVHGSSLMDERDWQVLAGTCRSPGIKANSNPSVYPGRFGDDRSDFRRVKRNEDGVHIHPKDNDYERSPRDNEKERNVKGRSDRGEGKRRDSYRLPSRDRSKSEQRRGNNREGDEDVAPRRREPS